MYSSLIWVFFSTFGIAFALRGARKSGKTRGALERLVSTVGFVALWVFQLCNALLWQLAWPYLIALTGNLGFAFVQFMGLVNPSVEAADVE